MSADLNIDRAGSKLRPRVLFLASASARRHELLGGLGIPFETFSPGIDETPRTGESPSDYAERMADEKARACEQHHPEVFVLAADTVVAFSGRIFGKPSGVAEARAMLEQLSGRTHEVITAYHLRGPGVRRAHTVTTEVDVARLSSREIDRYLASEEWQGKAGSYAIQGRFGYAVAAVRGSYTNVVGLPVHEVLQDLIESGVLPRFPL